MKSSMEQLNRFQNVRMTGAERERVRAALHAYMALRPLQRGNARALPSGFSIFLVRHRFFASVGVAFLVFALGGSTAVFAAESALPGDMLYPIKIAVEEHVIMPFARTPEQRVALETRRVERRLEEAEDLAIRGTLTPETEALLGERITAHTASAHAEASKIITPKDSDLAAHSYLESTLNAHGEVLATLAAEERQDTPVSAAAEVTALVSAIKKTSQSIAIAEFKGKTKEDAVMHAELSGADLAVGENTTVEDDEENAEAEQCLKDAEKKMMESRATLISEISVRAGAQTLAAAEARLQVAERAMREGRALLAAGDVEMARGLFHEARKIAKEVDVFVRASARVDLRSRASSNTSDDNRDGDVTTPQAKDELFDGVDTEHDIEF